MQHLREKPRPGTQLNLSRRLNKGLVGCWLFNEGSGIRAFDSSPYKNHGTLLNMAIPSCRSSQGLAFDGVDDYVDCGNKASLDITNFIISLYLKTTALGYRGIIQKADNNTPYAGYNINMGRTTTGKLYIYTKGGGWNNALGTAINDNIWHNIVIRCSGTSGTLYIDNVPYTFTGGSPDTNILSLLIGSSREFSNEPLYFFNGTINEVRIYNRALSASEIKLLYMNPYCMFMNVHGEA